MTQPTPEQLERAAELAPRVAPLSGLRAYRDEQGRVWFALAKGQDKPPEFVKPLDPRAFQAVVLALPEDLLAHILYAELWSDRGRLLFKWLLTPDGMLAFYEALAEYEKEMKECQ